MGHRASWEHPAALESGECQNTPVLLGIPGSQ